MENRHNQAIPAEVLAEVQTKIDEVTEKLKPYILNLTAAERQSQLKLGNKSLAFAEKALDYAQTNGEFVPSYLDLYMFKTDMQDATGLRVLEVSLQQLRQGIEDTVMVAGGEAYNEALVFYNAVKQAASQDIPGAKAIYSELKERFPGGRPKKQS